MQKFNVLGGLVLVFVCFMLSSCVDPNQATRVLKADGYKDVTITGYSFWGCSEDDFYKTGFRANKNNTWVEGVVCSGFLFKGSTIRILNVLN